MSTTGDLTPLTVVPRWTVDIVMPVWDKGRKRGQAVGWLNTNRPAAGRWDGQEHTKIRALWREAALLALIEHGVERGLDRIYLQVQFVFLDRIHRDIPNFEPTAKPCIDALQPDRTDWRKDKNGVKKPLRYPGRGIVLGDDRRYIIRGEEMEPGVPLGRDSDIGGIVRLHITPYPLAPSTA